MTSSGWLKGWVALLVVCGLVGASCGGDDGFDGLGNDSLAPESSSSTGESVPTGDPDGIVTVVRGPEIPEPATVWGEFLAEMDDDGRVSKETALEAFALAYGPIPGVEVRAGDHGPVASMTARSWLSHHMDQLTPEQTEAVHAALEVLDADGRPADEWLTDDVDGADDQEEASGAGGVELIAFSQQAQAPVPRSCWNNQPVVLANAPGSEPYRPLLDQELAQLQAKLGPLGIPVYLGFGKADGDVEADANAWNADCDQRASACTVRLLPPAVAFFSTNQASLRNVLLHELVHCYQGALVPVNNARNSLPWLIEGFANFAEQDIHPEAAWTFQGWWADWFINVATPLTERSYDAMGFFLHLVAIGADPWALLEASLATTQSTDQFAVFTGDVRQEFGETWASSVSRQPERGEAWDDALPAIPDTVPTIKTQTIDEGTRSAFTTAAFGVILTGLAFDAEVVVIDPTAGLGRLGWETGDEIVLDPRGHDMAFCAVAGGCECPEGQFSKALSGSATEFVTIPSDAALLALGADPSPGEVVITAMSILEACTPSDDRRTADATPWLGNVCELLSDADVAAVFGGRPPTSTEPADANTVAADGYGGASCRWKVSAGDNLLLDVFPAADVNIDALAGYDPHDRWLPDTLAGIGDEARVLRWNADSALPVAPGSVGAIVVLQGGVGLRLEITAGYPPEPDGLIAAARVILEGDD